MRVRAGCGFPARRSLSNETSAESYDQAIRPGVAGAVGGGGGGGVEHLLQILSQPFS
jgi:hypothetical protein